MESHAVQSCDEESGAISTTPIEQLRTISQGESIDSVRERVGMPSCVVHGTYGDGIEYQGDVYRLADGQSVRIFYIDGAASWGFFYDPHTKGQELIFGESPGSRMNRDG
jgi:hypothetical protein